MSSSRGPAALDTPTGQRGLLFIVSAPSGTGKTTIVERLVQCVPRLRMSRSYTSRTARAGERDGVDYNFIAREHFEAMIRDGAFLEYAVIYGNYYGTAAVDCERCLAGGEDVVLVIDVQGARQVRARALENIGIFVLPPSAAVLEQRLRGRSKDTEEQIRRRLEVAGREVSDYAAYDYVVVNEDVEASVARLHAIVMAERGRVERMRRQAEEIIGTFGKEEAIGKNTKREPV
jgi:guanylate kinase